MTTKILAIETSAAACSAALLVDGEVDGLFHFAPRLHGDLILPMVSELLSNHGIKLAEIDALAYGCGPGSFTGVRMASSVVQGLAFGVNKPVVPVSSLLAMAQGVYTTLGYTQVACAFDARMNEVYWGAYRLQAGEWLPCGEECVIAPMLVPRLPEGDWIGAGDGWQSYGMVLTDCTDIQNYYPRAYPNATAVAQLGLLGFLRGEYIAPAQALPTYLRNKVVST